MFRQLLLFFLTVILVTACSGPGIEHHADRAPKFVAEEFFSGPMMAYGVVKDRGGKVTRKFVAELNGSWENGQGVLRERFEFDDGEIQHRNWRLSPISPTASGLRQYNATAEDVVGTSTMSVVGDAVFMQYVLQIPFRGRTLNINVDDRMVLVAPHILIAESDLSKWGFNVGEIQLTIIKQPD